MKHSERIIYFYLRPTLSFTTMCQKQRRSLNYYIEMDFDCSHRWLRWEQNVFETTYVSRKFKSPAMECRRWSASSLSDKEVRVDPVHATANIISCKSLFRLSTLTFNNFQLVSRSKRSVIQGTNLLRCITNKRFKSLHCYNPWGDCCSCKSAQKFQ